MLKKIGKTFGLALTCSSLWWSVAIADGSLQITVNNTNVSMEEGFEVNVTATGSLDNDDVAIQNADAFDVSRRGTSTQMNIINGKVSKSTTLQFVFVPRKEGKFTVGPAVAAIDGKQTASQQVTITVSKQTNASGGETGDRPYYIHAEVDHLKPYVNQQVTLVFQFYRRVKFGNAHLSAPEFKKVWKEDLGEQQERQAVINGVQWLVTDVTYALFPTSAGKITIDPFTLTGQAILPLRGQDDAADDPFFGGLGFGRQEQRSVNLKTEPIVLEVQALPEPRPANFSGIVGEMTLDAQLSSQSVKVGETATLTVTVQGEGNIRDVNLQEPKIENAKVYADKAQSKNEPRGKKIVGQKVYRFAIVPQIPQTYSIPAIQLSVFNPTLQKYEQVSAPALSFSATGDAVAPNSSASAASNKLDVAIKDQDILPIHTTPSTVALSASEEKSLLGLTVTLPPLALVMGALRRRSLRSTLTRTQRARRAFEILKMGLNDENGFVELRKYLTAAFGVDGMALTSADLRHKLSGALQKENMETLEKLFSEFETLQYSGQTSVKTTQLKSDVLTIAKRMTESA